MRRVRPGVAKGHPYMSVASYVGSASPYNPPELTFYRCAGPSRSASLFSRGDAAASEVLLLLIFI